MEDKEPCSMKLFDNMFASKTMEYFFRERIAFIEENKYPLTLLSDPPCRFILHLIPENFQDIYLDVKNFERSENFIVPLNETKKNILCDFNFDGVLFQCSLHEKMAYTQVFRDGKIETVAVIAHSVTGHKENFLSLIKLQKNLVKCLENHVTVLSKNGISGPYYLFFRMWGTENMRLDPKDIQAAGYDSKGYNKPLIRNELIFPRYKIEHAQVNFPASLASFFDIIWNTFGFRGSPTKL
jgi:hypothetical protein